MENPVYSPEVDVYAIQLEALAIFCKICHQAADSKEKNIHRSKFVEACIQVIQQSLLILTEEDDIVLISRNISSFISLCRKCDGGQGLVFKEYVRRDDEYQKKLQSQNDGKSLKVISIRGASTSE